MNHLLKVLLTCLKNNSTSLRAKDLRSSQTFCLIVKPRLLKEVTIPDCLRKVIQLLKYSKMESKKLLSDEQKIEFALQGASKIKEMKSTQSEKFYHCYYYYFESGHDPTSMIKKEEGWYYPDVQKHIMELKEKWDEAGIPLDIVVEDRRIKIFHKTPSTIGSLAQLRLSPYLAYMFGYTSVVTERGQYLRFDEENEFHAPGEPKFFLDYCQNKDRENLFKSINSDLERKWQFYAETKIAEMKKTIELESEAKWKKTELELKEKIEKECSRRLSEEDLKLKDCRDREEKDITPLQDFDLIYDQYWTIKGVVQGGQMTNMGFDGNTQGKMFSLDIKDHTGNLNITAFSANAEVLSGLAVAGMEYYISNTNDENDITASINNNAYKIRFEVVD